MLSESQISQLRLIVRTCQIIVGVLALGVLNFTAVVLVITSGGSAKPAGQIALSQIAPWATGFAIVASFIIPMVLIGSMRRANTDSGATDDVRPCAQMYQTLMIIRCALLEGGAFFCLVSYLIERQTISLVATGVLLLVLLAQFPTMSRVAAWIENELKVAEEMRQLQQ